MTKYIYILFLLMPLMVSSQVEVDTVVTDSIKQIQVDQVEVLKAFNATLQTATQFSLKPELKQPEKVSHSYHYTVTIVPLELEYPDPVMRPLAMKEDPPFEVKKLYAKLGYGSIKNPYADIRFNDVINDLGTFGIDVYYDAADATSANLYQKHNTLYNHHESML
jgi:hypothetical protein